VRVDEAKLTGGVAGHEDGRDGLVMVRHMAAWCGR
jgi:hypothetical protein